MAAPGERRGSRDNRTAEGWNGVGGVGVGSMVIITGLAAGQATAGALGGPEHWTDAAARPQSKLRCGGGERATFGLGGPRKYGCDQTVCSGLSVVEQPTSLIGALNSPHDKSADERQSLETKPISRGTESSNPVPSSGESRVRT